MTMNVYGRTRNERLVQTVERVGEMVSVEEKHARSVPEPADTTTGDEGYTQVFQEVTTGVRTMPKGGFEPPRPVRHHPLKMACLPSSTTSASFYISKAEVFEPLELSDCAEQLSMGFSDLLLWVPRCRRDRRRRIDPFWCRRRSGGLRRSTGGRRLRSGRLWRRSCFHRWELIGNR